MPKWSSEQYVRTEYIIRLDDACPTMDAARWSKVESLLARHSLKPIVAVVPANTDPGLVRGPGNGKFWEQARGWAAAGWMIAMHGYSHALRPSASGIISVNRTSEFVGLPLEEQKRRIRDGLKLLQGNHLTPKAWVAPAHGMDKNTIEALRTESDIRVISDSFARRPVNRLGFTWIPQQLWRPRRMPDGLWTICLHPNEMSQADMVSLSSFIDNHKGDFPDPWEAASRAVPRDVSDMIFEAAFALALRIRKMRKSGEKDG